jgi:hypothetical protein
VSTLVGRIMWACVFLSVGMLLGDHASWAVSFLFCVLLALLLGFSVALAKIEKERDDARAEAIPLRHLTPWQVMWMDRVMGERGTSLVDVRAETSDYGAGLREARENTARIRDAIRHPGRRRPPDRFTITDPKEPNQ